MPTPNHTLLANLDPQQQDAVQAPGDHHLIIIAGAGTGKTRTITTRIAYRHHTGTANAANTLAVTHSTKAAAELRTRLASLNTPHVRTGTFHAAALRQISHFWHACNQPGNTPTLVDTRPGKQWGLIRDAYQHTTGTKTTRIDTTTITDITNEISWAQTQNLTPATYATAAARAGHYIADTNPNTIADTWTAYTKLKTINQLIDFTDILHIATELLTTNDHIANTIRTQYRHLVIDEFQDTDPAQSALLHAWTGPDTDITIVGDPRQTIYTFKGADPTQLDTFEQHFTNKPTTTVTLNRNYRSTPQITDLANRLLPATGNEHNLTSTRQPGPAPTITNHPTTTTEHDAIAANITSHLRAGHPAGQIAVLVRTRAHQGAITAALTNAGIPVAAAAGSFFTHPAITELLTHLRQQPAELPAADTLTHTLAAAHFDPNNPPDGAGAARERWEIRNAVYELYINTPLNTADMLNDLHQRRDNEHTPQQTNAVTITTLHAAKGREWDTVILPGLTNGTLPIVHAKTAAQKDEEKRLLYVGITRARTNLHCSWSSTHTLPNGRPIPTKPSPFLTALTHTPTPPRAPRPSSNRTWEHGQRVNHDRHGLGRIIKTDTQRVTVDFGSSGTRTIAASAAELQPL